MIERQAGDFCVSSLKKGEYYFELKRESMLLCADGKLDIIIL